VSVPALRGDLLLAQLAAAGALTPAGLTLPPDTTYERYEEIGRHLGKLRDLTSWALGDWLIAGERLFGEDGKDGKDGSVAQAIEATRRPKSSLLEYRRVAERFPRERRRDLPWSHHQVCAALPPDEQDRWLDEAVDRKWSVEELRGAIREPRRLGMGEQLRGAARALLRVAEFAEAEDAIVPVMALDTLAAALGEDERDELRRRLGEQGWARL
jgi:hypothetical protein